MVTGCPDIPDEHMLPIGILVTWDFEAGSEFKERHEF